MKKKIRSNPWRNFLKSLDNCLKEFLDDSLNKFWGKVLEGTLKELFELSLEEISEIICDVNFERLWNPLIHVVKESGKCLRHATQTYRSEIFLKTEDGHGTISCHARGHDFSRNKQEFMIDNIGF